MVLLAVLDLEGIVGGGRTGVDAILEQSCLVVLALVLEGLAAPDLVHDLEALDEARVGFGQVAGLAAEHRVVLPRTRADTEEVAVLQELGGVADLDGERTTGLCSGTM